MVELKKGMKSFKEWATAVFLFADSYLLKNYYWVFFRKETAILVSYYKIIGIGYAGIDHH